MEKLTELEKQKVITCVYSVANDFEIAAQKLEIEYNKYDYYIEEFEEKISGAKERQRFYYNLAKKLEEVF